MLRLIQSLLIGFLLLVTACSSSPEAPAVIDTSARLIEAMEARYEGKWYETLTFLQETIQHRPDGRVDTTLWYEALSLPGKLRIDIETHDSGNGMLFRQDTLYAMQGGQVTNSRALVHPLLLLGFDVYFLPAEATLARLDSMGFDLSVMHETSWQGRPTYVVGAEAGDERSSQFWIDKEHLYFVRLFQPVGPEATNIQQIQFNAYETLGGGWIAPEVLFYVDGNLVLVERYSEMKSGMSFSDGFFDPDQWASAPHWAIH